MLPTPPHGLTHNQYKGYLQRYTKTEIEQGRWIGNNFHPKEMIMLDYNELTYVNE